MTEPLITSRTDWTENLLYEVYNHIEDIALNDLKLDVYPNQIEVISAEQMIDAYASVGMPVNYNHWSFGKEFLSNWTRYQKGQMGLAYEIVINSNPCISYLMEENNAITQALVIAHAAFGHNHVFKNNYVFKEWTNAGSIIDYMLYSKNYIRDCEMRYGEDSVEKILDAAHALSAHGIDKRKRKHKKKLSEEEMAQQLVKMTDEEQKNLDIIIKSTTAQAKKDEPTDADLDDAGGEENLIYFIYKNSPTLEEWQREILRIVYKIQQYFYPQRQTQTVNEGFATFTHFHIMNELEKRGIISADAQISWLHQHSNVVLQATYKDKWYDGRFNPYALGFSIFKEIKRICEEPTKEDEEWFPSLVGQDWRAAVKEGVSDYRDESFIQQFMSPKLIRDLRLFTIEHQNRFGLVTEISDDIGYRNIRDHVASSKALINSIPDITVKSARMRGDRMLTLEYHPYHNRSLHSGYTKRTLHHVKTLWGYDVEIVQVEKEHPFTQKVLFSTQS